MARSTVSTSLPGQIPVRLPTRKICVSTACAGCRHHMFRTTLAVLRPDTRKGLQGSPGIGNLAAILVNQDTAELDDVLGLLAEQANGLDVLDQAFLAQIQHLLRRVGDLEQVARRFVDTRIRGLRRKGHGDDQSIDVHMLQLALGFRVGLLESA